jgi:hypothetical protein
MVNEMQAAVVQGLQQKYKVFSGDRVLQELKKAADKANHRAKHDCDETRCLQDIATAFQTENVAIVHINKIDGGYLLSLSIKAVISNEAIFDNSIPCEGCNAFKVVAKLKELGGYVPSVDEPPPIVKINDAEIDVWEDVKKSNTVDDYQAYLKQYPNGKYKELAKIRLAKLLTEANQIRELATAKAKRKQDQSPSIITRDLLSSLVINYYNKNSEWAGIFTIESIARYRIVNFDLTKKQAHVAYQYVAIPGNKNGRNDSGVDTRTFDLVWTSGKWQVTKMGDHLSGNL